MKHQKHDTELQPLRLVRQYFLALLVLAYGCSFCFPWLGQRLRTEFSSATEVSCVHLMLSVLLLTLGLSVRLDKPTQILAQARWIGLFFLVRMLAVILLAVSLGWVASTYTGSVVGFVLLLAAPSAASSAGWSLHWKASQTTSAALSIGTTLLSLVFGPLCLTVAGAIGQGVGALGSGIVDLEQLRHSFRVSFVVPWVVLPTFVGVAWRWLAPRSAERIRSMGHLANPLILLLLNYSNAATSLSKIQAKVPCGSQA